MLTLTTFELSKQTALPFDATKVKEHCKTTVLGLHNPKQQMYVCPADYSCTEDTITLLVLIGMHGTRDDMATILKYTKSLYTQFGYSDELIAEKLAKQYCELCENALYLCEADATVDTNPSVNRYQLLNLCDNPADGAYTIPVTNRYKSGNNRRISFKLRQTFLLDRYANRDPMFLAELTSFFDYYYPTLDLEFSYEPYQDQLTDFNVESSIEKSRYNSSYNTYSESFAIRDKSGNRWLPYIDTVKLVLNDEPAEYARYNEVNGVPVNPYSKYTPAAEFYPLSQNRDSAFYRQVLPMIHLIAKDCSVMLPIGIVCAPNEFPKSTLQMIHAALHESHSFIGNVFPYVLRIPDSADNFNIEAKTLRKVLTLSIGNMLVFDCYNPISLSMYLQTKEIQSILQLFSNDIQYVFIYHSTSQEEGYELLNAVIEEAGLHSLNPQSFPASKYVTDLGNRQILQNRLGIFGEHLDSCLEEFHTSGKDVDSYISDVLHSIPARLDGEILDRYDTLKSLDSLTTEQESELDILKTYVDLCTASKDTLDYSPLIHWTDTEQLGLVSQDEFNRAIAKISSIYRFAKRAKGITARHIAITGNCGTGKLTFAKVAANILQSLGVTSDEYTISPATAFIGQYQGQSSTNVIKFFSQNTGKTLIITGLSKLLDQCDYGQQVLNEIGVQMQQCSKDTLVILTDGTSEFDAIRAKKPDIDTTVGTVIRLNDYSKSDLYKMVCMKLNRLGVSLTSGELESCDIENAIEDLIYSIKDIPSTDELKFNMKSSLSLDDVIGNEIAKEELSDIVKNISNANYIVPKGILLHGRPGTGKTMLAKAFAHDAGIPFCAVPSSYFSNHDGQAVSRVQKLFREARKRRRCAIFIDEIESIAPSRDDFILPNPVLTQLLQEIDGFGSTRGVIVIAATNHIERVDPALLRAGRFDRKINVELPNRFEREELFCSLITKAVTFTPEIYTRVKLSSNPEDALREGMAIYMKAFAGIEEDINPNVNIGLLLQNGHFAEKIAKSICEQYCMRKNNISLQQPPIHNPNTPIRYQLSDTIYATLALESTGASGALIEAIVNRAVNASAMSGCLTDEALLNALSTLTEGCTSNVISSDAELERTAYHEMGHAMVSLLERDPRLEQDESPAQSLKKVSIIPRNDGFGTALGLTTMYDDYTSSTKASLIRAIKICFGGRVAEELRYGANNISSGCIADMQTASNVARELVCTLGLYDQFGYIHVDANTSEATKALADTCINNLLMTCMSEVRTLLASHVAELHLATAKLLTEQELSGDQVFEMLGA